MSDSSMTVGGPPLPERQSAGPALSADDGKESLQRRLGTSSIVLTVMAWLAPLAASAGFIPFIIGYGNGLGAPLTFLLCGAVLALFSCGYLAMVRSVPRPGAFYAFVTAGLGKRVGLGVGGLTLVFYQLGAIGFYIFGGLTVSNLAQNDFNTNVPWWAGSAAIYLIVCFCSYRGIDFNARVLGVIVSIEFAIVAMFNIVALVSGGPTGHSAQPFTWEAFTSGSIAVAVLFAIAFFTGFESTAVYREEARDPSRTIPRATFIVITVITLFYALTAYCFIIALGTDNAVAQTADDPAGSFGVALNNLLGQSFSQIITLLVVTSVLAAEIAMINGSTRYVYSLSVDQVLPSKLAAVHPRHRSPYRAAIVSNILTAVGVGAVVVTGLDVNVAYGIFSGVTNFGFQALVILVSLSAIVYFRRNRGTGESVWNVLIAPGLTIVAFGWLLYFSAAQSELLLGTPTPLTPVLFGVLGGAFIIGFALACWLARSKPDVFNRIGRAQA